MQLSRRGIVGFVLLTALVEGLNPASARAQDIRLPPWTRGAPFTTFYEWEFLTGLNPLPPDSLRPPIVGNGGGGGPLATMFNMVYDPTGGGSWTALAPFGVMEFNTPDCIDHHTF